MSISSNEVDKLDVRKIKISNESYQNITDYLSFSSFDSVEEVILIFDTEQKGTRRNL